jgi:hypothetical protein
VSRARWSCFWRRTCEVKTAKRGRNSLLTTMLNTSWYACSTILFCKLLFLLNWIWWLLFFIFRRPIITSWERDIETILWPIRNSIQICGWRLDRLVDPIKIGFTGSLTLWPRTCGSLVVFQPLGASNQYRAPNLRSSWSCSNTRLNSPKNTYQRRMNNSKRRMHNKKRSMTSFANLSWTWHHRVVIHVCLLLLLQRHHYINL